MTSNIDEELKMAQIKHLEQMVAESQATVEKMREDFRIAEMEREHQRKLDEEERKIRELQREEERRIRELEFKAREEERRAFIKKMEMESQKFKIERLFYPFLALGAILVGIANIIFK